ncbi:MAG: acylglycerol kinase family protein, partial [Blastocatellia bacterium]|nr:acylglycerol kinase family protein [Blastocatellia bacterium]
MKTLAIINPAAGFGKCARLLGPALDRLRAAGLQFETAHTKRAGHATEIAREAYRNGYCKFIAVGGDGTSFEIVNGLFPEAANGGVKPWLGFMPLGTGNSFLRDFTDEGTEFALRAIIEERRRECDVIRLKHKEGEVFYI